MTNWIWQRIPGYNDAEFNNATDLVEISWIKEFAEREGFHRFSVRDHWLIAEYNGGATWTTVGLLRKPKEVGLPKHKVLTHV
jgi:hypothetical protein